VSMQDLHFTMPLSKASVKLMLACATGQHIPGAILTCRKAGGEQEEFLTITFSDVLVSSYQVGGHGGNISATDQASLAFHKLQFKYQQQSEKGNVGSPVLAGWDVKANKKF
jgi:type VI secretion system secreted protein Hcp